jgi:signal peptidase I
MKIVFKLICSATLIIFISGCKGKPFRASSSSMEGTIMAGDIIYVTRTHEFKRNDIVVFDYYGQDYSSPEKDGTFKMHWSKRFYRLIALSGDSLLIKNGDVIVNGRYIPLPATALGDYTILSKVPVDDFPKWQNFPPILLFTNNKDSYLYDVRLVKEEADDYNQRKPAIVSVTKKIDYNTIDDSLFAKSSANGKWTPDNYGPLAIPSPGETITVDAINYKLYHNIPGIRMGVNKITEPLYFVMGDNRHGAEDSRFIGFIAHSKMVGIVK